MLSISCKPSETGFWYMVSAPIGSVYSVEFIAFGISGHQTSGELCGSVVAADEWRHEAVHFPVMQAAVTCFSLRRNHSAAADEIEAPTVRAPVPLPAAGAIEFPAAAADGPYGFSSSAARAGLLSGSSAHFALNGESSYGLSAIDGQLAPIATAASWKAATSDGPYAFGENGPPFAVGASLPLVAGASDSPYAFGPNDSSIGIATPLPLVASASDSPYAFGQDAPPTGTASLLPLAASAFDSPYAFWDDGVDLTNRPSPLTAFRPDSGSARGASAF